MTTLREKFIVPKRYNTVAFVLMALGIIAIIVLYIYTHSAKGPADYLERRDARFWASLLQNSVYFLLVTNAAMFFFCATTLAWAGFQMSFRRVTEAISACVPVIGIITTVVLLSVCFSSNNACIKLDLPELFTPARIVSGRTSTSCSTESDLKPATTSFVMPGMEALSPSSVGRLFKSVPYRSP